MHLYKSQCLDNLRNIVDYLELLIKDSGDEFIDYQEYYMQHYKEIDIPYDFTEYRSAHHDFQALVLQADEVDLSDSPKLGFSGLSEEEKKAYFIYRHEYWTLVFENARKSFNLPYTYYLVPDEEDYLMYYMIDGERSHKNADGFMSDEGENLYLGDVYYNPYEKYYVQWNTWFSGTRQNDFQVWDTDWGHTYAYYSPLIINGKKLGLIAAEVNVKSVYDAVLKNTLTLSIGIIVGVILCIAFIFYLLNLLYIKKIVRLESDMREYAEEKDPDIVRRIKESATGKDEISSLSRQFATMITEVERYMQTLRTTSEELDDTKKFANKMNSLANKDALTGIRNKTAYDNEFKRLEWNLESGIKTFGFAMIDLNDLKQINDTYGHEQGNAAIKKLSYIVCHVFDHSPVFRIGGDEFVVILEKSDYNQIKSLIQEFNSQIEQSTKDTSVEPWERVSAAIGYALYDESLDRSVSDVFNRADKAMYVQKRLMKVSR
ncbi:MAG: diguanylate cyclase [Treponema sp.]|nr:diguanylate cyclase [Treponema sp.]